MSLRRGDAVDVHGHGRGLFSRWTGCEHDTAEVYAAGRCLRVEGYYVKAIKPDGGEYSRLVAVINAAKKAGLVAIHSSGLLTALTPDVELVDGSVRMLWEQRTLFRGLPAYYSMFVGRYTVYRGDREVWSFSRDNAGAYVRALRLLVAAIERKEVACAPS